MHIDSNDFALAGNGNILKEIDINVIDAILGCSIDIKDIEDKTLNVKIPMGSKEGSTLRIPKKGLYIGNIRGDLHLIIHNIFPKNLTDNQKELLKRFKNDSN